MNDELHMTPLRRAKELVDKAWSSNDWRNYDTAQAILEAAIAVSPADPTLLICLGAVLSDRGEHARAVTVLEKAVELGSTDRNVYLNLAIALMNCDSVGRRRARCLFDKAKEMEPSPETWEAYFDAHGH